MIGPGRPKIVFARSGFPNRAGTGRDSVGGASRGLQVVIAEPRVRLGGGISFGHGFVHERVDVLGAEVVPHLAAHFLHPPGHALRVVLIQSRESRRVRQAFEAGFLGEPHANPRRHARHFLAAAMFADGREGFGHP